MHCTLFALQPARWTHVHNSKWPIIFKHVQYVQCKLYILVHVTSMIKCFDNIFIFFRLEMFTRRKSTAWTGGCFSLKLSKTIYYLQPFPSCALKKCALINISLGGSSATGTSRGPKQTSGSTSNTYKTSYLWLFFQVLPRMCWFNAILVRRIHELLDHFNLIYICKINSSILNVVPF